MHDLLVVNGVTFPIPEGSLDIKYSNRINEYEGEDGSITVEIIRENIASISVSYNGLLETQLNLLLGALKTVNEVTFYKKGTEVTCFMKATDISTPEKYYKHSISVWGFSFGLQEL